MTDKNNIHINLIPEPDPVDQVTQGLAAYEVALINQHRLGLHPFGQMRRECPLCRAS